MEFGRLLKHVPLVRAQFFGFPAQVLNGWKKR